MKVLVVSSVGGHLTEIMALAEHLEGHEVVLVVNDEVQLPSFPFYRVYRVAHSARDWRLGVNILQAAAIFDRERPDMLLSAGAGVVVPFALIARVAGGCRIVFLETAAAVSRPTLTGRMMYPLAHDFLYQWPRLKPFFPRGRETRALFP